MSRVLVELLGLAPTSVHTTELDLPRLELRLEVTDPRSGEARVLPPGPKVSLVDGGGTVLSSASIDADGCAHLLGEPDATDVSLRIDFADREWLDLEAGAYVAAGEVRANDPRALLRLPSRWDSRDQPAFSDDRSGAFSTGVLSTLDDGALGTATTPWVLRIDHAWRKFLLELRYTNTHTGGQAPLPPGPQLEAAYDVSAPKFRLAAASTVLDAQGLVALWIFDHAGSLADLRVLLRAAPHSYIEMHVPTPGLVELPEAKHRAMLPKARARLHPLPKVLRLHEQPAHQGSHRGILASILPLVASAPSRVRVPIDVPVELRLVLHDPVSGGPMAIPADVEVTLTDARDRPLTTARVGEDGRVSLFLPPGSREVGVEIGLADAPYLDLVNAAFVPTADAEPNVKLRLVRLPDRWRSVDQPELSDDRGGKVVDGRLTEVSAGELGTPDSPWELDLGHAWQRTELVFQYYDVTARAVMPVVFGPPVEAFDDARLRDRDLVAGSTVLDAGGRVHLMFFRPVDPAKVRVRLRTAVDTVVATTEPDPELCVRPVGPAALKAMTVADRQRHYPLPRLWLSRGQACRTEDATSATATLFEEAIASARSTEVVPPRLHFDLDDFVLVNRSGVPLLFARELDLTIFHHDMSIRAPKTSTHQPYFSDLAAGLNHFAGNRAFYTVGGGAERTARVVRRGKTFYDLTGRRTTKGKIIGARAAVAGDHPHEHVFLKHEPGTSPNLANCDLHYFEDIAGDPATPNRTISVLLVFFSVRIRLIEAPAFVRRSGTMVRVQVVPADGVALQQALGAAAERWSGTPLSDVLAGAVPNVPDVRLRADTALHDVKFVFHFPAFDDREGHAVVWLRPVPRAFSLSTFGIIVVAKGDATPGTALPGVEHGHAYPSETIAHELGHSMGLGDEYFESMRHAEIPSKRQFAWDFLHLSFDRHSMMDEEREPRLRHYWVFSRWLERSAEIPRVRPDEYALVCDTSALPGPGTGRAHAFRLPREHSWPYQPVREEPRFRPGKGGRGRLGLHLLGDDMDVFNLPRSGVLAGIDAVLHWDLVIYIRRRRNADGNDIGRRARFAVAERLHDDMAAAIGAIRPAAGPTAGGVAQRCLVAELDSSAPASALAQRHVRRVLLYVLPRFTFSDPGSADFRVHVRPPSATPGGDVTDLHDPGLRGRKIRIHTDVRGHALLRYMMGMGAAAAHTPAVVRVLTAPLAPGASLAIGTSTVPSTVLTAVHGPRTSGANDYDATGTPAQVATELAAALNDPANAYAAHMVAHASASEVILEAIAPGTQVALISNPIGTEIQREWEGDIAPDEAQFVADWIGEQLGATYRMRAYD